VPLSPLFSPRRLLGRPDLPPRKSVAGSGGSRRAPRPVRGHRAAGARGGNQPYRHRPMYENGYSEEIVGRALRESGLRQRVFLIDKLDQPDAPAERKSTPRLRQARPGLHRRLRAPRPFHDGRLAPRRSARRGARAQSAPRSSPQNTLPRHFSHNPDVLAAAIPPTRGYRHVPRGAIRGPSATSRDVPPAGPQTPRGNRLLQKPSAPANCLGDTEGLFKKPLASRPRGKGLVRPVRTPPPRLAAPYRRRMPSITPLP